MMQPGAETRKTSFSHQAVRTPDFYTGIILPDRLTSNIFSVLPVRSGTAPQKYPEYRTTAE